MKEGRKEGRREGKKEGRRERSKGGRKEEREGKDERCEVRKGDAKGRGKEWVMKTREVIDERERGENRIKHK